MGFLAVAGDEQTHSSSQYNKARHSLLGPAPPDLAQLRVLRDLDEPHLSESARVGEGTER